MRIRLLLGTTLLALSGAAFAQSATPAQPMPPPGPMAPHPTAGPGPQMPPLTAEQKVQVQAIMMDETQRTRDRLAKVLTKEQMAALDARMQAHMMAPRGPQPIAPADGMRGAK